MRDSPQNDWRMKRFVNSIAVILLAAIPVYAGGTNAAVTVGIDALANRHAISPLIYGVGNQVASPSNHLAELNASLFRLGGNLETRDNWQINTHQQGQGWYFESLADTGSTASSPPGWWVDNVVTNTKNGGAQPMITVSMIGWMPKLGASRGALWSYSIAKYGPQTDNDWQWRPDAGIGVGTNSGKTWLITTNDPTDANYPTNALFGQAFIQHLTNRWGCSTNGGVPYYILDNEHSIWHETHQDVHPQGATMQEIWSNMLAHASMIKTNDPNALVLGPEEYGWWGYLYSGKDNQYMAANNAYGSKTTPDRVANGGWDYIPWLLNQFHQYSTNHGNQRLLDYLTVHCYPADGSVSGSSVSTKNELLRNQTTRVLWDTNFTDPAVNAIQMVIPRLKSWVTNYYPGTKIGITEYSWGADANINGATAQADALGILGREGVDLASRWTDPATNTPTYQAMKLYRNYDGNKSTFGDTSILTTMPNPDILSAFSALRTSDGTMTLMVINKDLTNATPITAILTNFNGVGIAQRWQLTSATNKIIPLANINYTNKTLNDLVPSQSITLYLLPVPATLQVGTQNPVGQLGLWLRGEMGQTNVVLASTNLINWSTYRTNILSSNPFEIFLSITNSPRMFYVLSNIF